VTLTDRFASRGEGRVGGDRAATTISSRLIRRLPSDQIFASVSP